MLVSKSPLAINPRPDSWSMFAKEMNDTEERLVLILPLMVEEMRG